MELTNSIDKESVQIISLSLTCVLELLIAQKISLLCECSGTPSCVIYVKSRKCYYSELNLHKLGWLYNAMKRIDDQILWGDIQTSV
jgi:hypothetical protein